MLIKSAIAAHVALLKKEAATALPEKEVVDPVAVKKQELKEREQVADIASLESATELKELEAQQNIDANKQKMQTLQEQAPEEDPGVTTMPGTTGATPGATTMAATSTPTGTGAPMPSTLPKPPVPTPTPQPQAFGAWGTTPGR
jgi:uncharacterized membrane protein